MVYEYSAQHLECNWDNYLKKTERSLTKKGLAMYSTRALNYFLICNRRFPKKKFLHQSRYKRCYELKILPLPWKKWNKPMYFFLPPLRILSCDLNQVEELDFTRLWKVHLILVQFCRACTIKIVEKELNETQRHLNRYIINKLYSVTGSKKLWHYSKSHNLSWNELNKSEINITIFQYLTVIPVSCGSCSTLKVAPLQC